MMAMKPIVALGRRGRKEYALIPPPQDRDEDAFSLLGPRPRSYSAPPPRIYSIPTCLVWYGSLERGGGVRWEEVPLADYNAADDHADGEDEPKTLKEKATKALKILLPHVGLTTLLLSYIAGGAAVFQWLEREKELETRGDKLGRINATYFQIANLSYSLCGSNDAQDIQEVLERLKPYLLLLSSHHEYDEKFTHKDQVWKNMTDFYPDGSIDPKWTFQAAVLYALTVITTTGYDHVTPLTDTGRLFTVFFGLFGIPLMFITAADIGKFLSECVTTFYAKLVFGFRYIRRQLCKLKLRCCTSTQRSGRSDTTPNGDIKKDSSASDPNKDPLSEDDELDRVQLPIFAYFFLILGYCAIGGFMFTQWEKGPIWTFIHGFFFSFNTITTIGLGNVLCRNAFYLILIVAYVIVGLAVITMCVDLASSQLKVFFTKIHYFGRKFRGARAFMNMSDDIKEAMKIIAALKRTKNNPGGNITLEDIKNFLEIEQQYMARPFVPPNINFMRWVDDEEVSSARSGSMSLKHVSSDPALHM